MPHPRELACPQYAACAIALGLSLEKVTYDRPDAKVFYHTAYNPYFKQNTSPWSAPDFIA